MAYFYSINSDIWNTLPSTKVCLSKIVKKFVAQLQPQSIAIFHGNDEMPRSGDGNFAFRQQSDLYWLSGIDQEQTILVICPEHPLPEYREVLFLRKTNEHIAVWEGHKYTKEEGRNASGIQHIFWTDDFQSMLPVMMHHSKKCVCESEWEWSLCYWSRVPWWTLCKRTEKQISQSSLWTFRSDYGKVTPSNLNRK